MPGTVVVPTLSGTGPTFRELYMDLADELGFLHQVTVTTLASNGESLRTLRISAAQDDSMAEGMGEWSDWWVYVVDGTYAGAQRRVLHRGHLGNEAALILSRPFLAPLQANTTVLITSPLPITSIVGSSKGLKQLVNAGLNRILVEGRLEFTGTGYDTYSLTGYPFVRDTSQTTGLFDRLPAIPSGNALQPSSYGYHLEANGSGVNLVTDYAYAADATFQLGIIARADRLIFDGSAWGYAASPGLVDDDDQAACAMEWVRAFGMVKALQFLDRVLEHDPLLDDATKARRRQIVAERKPTYVRAANRIAITAFPQPFIPARTGMVSIDYGRTGLTGSPPS